MKANEPSTRGDYAYAAFISYSHAADGRLGPAIEDALQRFGKPWYSRSSIQVFRDQTGLALTPDLWGEIQESLEKSVAFILLASPESAQSEWVAKEVRFWLEHRPDRPLLVVLTGGELAWAHDDFDWSRTTALPRALEKTFKAEPLWADLRWAKTEADLSLRRPRFFVEIAKLIAGMRQEPLRAVFDAAAEQQRRAMRWLRVAVAALAVLAAGALGVALVSVQAKRTADQLAADKAREVRRQQEVIDQRNRQEGLEKQQQRNAAASARLAGKASAVLAEDRELSTLLALEAARIAPTREAERALRQALVEPPPVLILRGQTDNVYSAQFNADATRILTSGADGAVRLWNAASGSNVLTLPPPGVPDSSHQAFGTFSPDGTRVLTMLKPDTLGVGYWTNTGVISIHEAASGRMLVSITEGFAVTACLSPDNNQLATGGFDTAVKLWDARTGKLRAELAGHEGRIPSASFSSNGLWLLTGSWDGTARVWDSATGKNLAVLNTGKMVDASAFSADGKMVLTLAGDRGGEHKYLQLWDWSNTPGGSVAAFSGHEGSIQDFALSADAKRLVTGGTDNTARIWDAATGKCLHVLRGHTEFVNSVDISPNGEWVATASGDGSGRIWETATGESLMGLGGSEVPRFAVAFSRDGKRILTTTAGPEVLVHDGTICGSLQDLLALARPHVTRQLTAEERQKYLSDAPAP